MKKYLFLLCFLTINVNALQILKNPTDKPTTPSESVQQIQNLAKTGDTGAQFKLANMYHTGDRVEKDEKLAFYWYQQVANRGYASAQFNVANSYYNGTGVKKDIDESIKWYTKASNKGMLMAIYNLAVVLEVDKKDYKSSFKWYKKAADLNDGLSQLKVARMYANGTGIEKDDKQAQFWFTTAIKNNTPNAKYHFAEFLSQNKKTKEAIDLYIKAANEGSFLAQYNLANMYLQGKLVKKDKAKALVLATKAANAGYHPAQQLLGTMYQLDKNLEKSVFWYQKAADNKNAKAQYTLGVFYLNGIGVKKDVYKSTTLFIKAAEQDHTEAQYSLALRYLRGESIEKKPTEAVKWLLRAAKKNHGLAQLSLSRRYNFGEGVEEDQKQRVFWLTKASENSNKDARYELAAITLLGTQTKFSIPEATAILQNFVDTDDRLSAKANYILGRFLLNNKLKEIIKTDGQHPVNAATNESVTATIKPTVSIAPKVATMTVSPPTKPKLKNAPQSNPVKQPVRIVDKVLENTITTANSPIESMYRLAIMYLNGHYVKQDYTFAFHLMQKAAVLGFLPAQNDLAFMYFKGIGTQTNYKEAYNLALTSSQAGFKPAYKTLGLIKNKINEIKSIK